MRSNHLLTRPWTNGGSPPSFPLEFEVPKQHVINDWAINACEVLTLIAIVVWAYGFSI